MKTTDTSRPLMPLDLVEIQSYIVGSVANTLKARSSAIAAFDRHWAEHAALLAVTEAAKEFRGRYIAVIHANLNGNTSLQLEACEAENIARHALENALAALAAVRDGKAVQS